MLILFSGCESSKEDLSEKSSDNSTTNENQSAVDIASIDTDAMFTERDCRADYDEAQAIKIELNKTSATASDSSVKISGSTITLTKEMTHIISGSLDDGMIIVDAENTAKLQLVLKGIEIKSSSCAPIYIKQADKVFITLEGESTLENGGKFEAVDENNIDSVIFSKQDLTFNGSGTVNVNSPSGHGVVSKDDLVFISGNYNIASSGHAIDANDSVRVKNAKITVDSAKDGIHCENTDDTSKGFVYVENGDFDIECEGDGISSGSYMQIKDGKINILAGGGYENGSKTSSDNFGQFGGGFGGGMPGGRNERRNPSNMALNDTQTTDESSTSMKGLKCDNTLLISNGTFVIDSADDSIHSNISVTVNGGDFQLSSGDDAIHAEENLDITNGNIAILQSYEGLEALNVKVSGGNINLKADDDGLNAAGGTDNSGMGGRDNMFGKAPGGMGGSSNGSITVSGGTLYINSSGDGMDANGTLEISGGYITVVGPTQGDTATLDYDVSATISGATFIGTGASNMAQSLSSSNQGVVAVSVGNQSAQTKITLTDKKGNTIISHSPELSFAVVILSSPEIKSGETYSLSVGSQTADITAD